MKRNTPKFIKKVDFTTLRTQKTLLLETINNDAVDPEHKESLEGILALIDALQDYAVDTLGVPEMLVFDFELEEGRETKPTKKKKTKCVEICTHCNSDNVELKAWVLANEGYRFVDLVEGDDMGYCRDCGLPSAIDSADLKINAKVIGFQVVGDDGTTEEGMIHPKMEASFCLYSLSQAREMLESDIEGQWRLLTIWSGDVEEPTIMFEGDSRS